MNFDELAVKHRDRFDVVLNFGTTEHIFNQWNSFAIIHEAMKIDGILYCVLPASGYLDHGYYCYTPIFFKDLASANGYEIIDMFFAHAGENKLSQLNADVRDDKNLLLKNSVKLSETDDRIPSFNIHVVMQKKVDKPFTCGLEVATAHSNTNSEISARYAKNSALNDDRGLIEVKAKNQQLEEQLSKMYSSRSWKITKPLRLITTLLLKRRNYQEKSL